MGDFARDRKKATVGASTAVVCKLRVATLTDCGDCELEKSEEEKDPADLCVRLARKWGRRAMAKDEQDERKGLSEKGGQVRLWSPLLLATCSKWRWHWLRNGEIYDIVPERETWKSQTNICLIKNIPNWHIIMQTANYPYCMKNVTHLES